MFSIIPSKAAIWAALATAGVALIGLIRLDARRDERRNAKIKDYEHAEDIERRVSDSRADPDRLRSFEGAGYRD